LAKAYKQWAVASSHLWSSVIARWNPELQRPAIMVQYALPFGATSSVLHFNRLSRLIRAIIAVLLRALVLCFYDDFPQFEPEASAVLLRKMVQTLLAALGWKFSDNPNKSFPFAATFDALGVTFNLSRVEEKRSARSAEVWSRRWLHLICEFHSKAGQ
jgi:hypothetical protein